LSDASSESETVERPPGSTLGEEIGPYRLLQRIGEGGFGSVFEAEQLHPVRRRVALKIIKLGMDTEQVIARFEAERQALALMDHPHIARVLDAGATPAGRPYFVMELVKGAPITEYADRERLTIGDRLRLFDQVCAAVQHAHTKGILHRDLKPSNVLVSTEDGKPFARVIDFGVAKATAARLTEKVLYTELHSLVGTPLYMSPEQAAGSPDIDTRTDVYALGVLLYELLTGTTPIDQRAFRESSYAEVQRVIREVDPPRPSTRVSESAETSEKNAPTRRTEPRRLAGALKGELDWIVMKALEKDRARRYETANGLAMDVRRYLAGEPVLAAPPSATYRFGKFVRRHRVAVAAGLVVALTLVAGIVGTSVGLVRADRQRRAAEKVASFLKNLLEGIGPAVARGRATTLLKEMVSQASQRIEKGELNDSPEAEVDLRLAIGSAEGDLSDFAAAERMLVPALEKARAVFGVPSVPVGDALLSLSTLRFQQGRYAETEPLARECLDVRKKLGPARGVKVAEATEQLAMTLLYEKKPKDAEVLMREAVAIYKEAAPSDGDALGRAGANLGLTLVRQGRDVEAEPVYRDALAACRKYLPDPHPRTATVMNNLAVVLVHLKKWPEAEATYREALAMYRRVLGPEHPSLGFSLVGLAAVAEEQGRLDEAESLLREALAIMTKGLGADHPNVAIVSGKLTKLLEKKKQTAAK
jgi:serine/threonine protein kinase/tetratricopeptide (TPR) repeat protein